MRNVPLSLKVYFALLITLAITAAISVFLPSFQGLIPQELPASKPVMALVNACVMLFLYGGLGFLGWKLSQKLGFADIWDSNVNNKQRFLIPLWRGIIIGIFLIIADSILSRYHSLGLLPHPEFPLSILASITAGIGEEIIFRLFFIPFWVWLISYVILKGRRQNIVFWIVVVFSALTFAIGHFPAVMLLFEVQIVSELPTVLIVEIILLNGVLSVFAAYYFRKYGFLAAVGIHFWADVVWHVIWGLTK